MNRQVPKSPIVKEKWKITALSIIKAVGIQVNSNF